MSREPDVLDLLADARPGRLEPPADRRGPAAAVTYIVAQPRSGLSRHDRSRHSARVRIAVFGSAGLAAAAAAVTAVALAAGPGTVPAAPDPGHAAAPASSTAAPVSPERLLLLAAERTDRITTTTGRYLVQREEFGFSLPIESPGGPYTMIGQERSETWLARSGTKDSFVLNQWLGAVPASPADEAAWRRAGAPTEVFASRPKPAKYTTTAGQPSGNSVAGSDLYALGDHNATQAELDALPTEPAALRTALLKTYSGGGSDMPTDRDQWLFVVAGHVLIDLPVSNPVRAATYRLLSSLPGVRALGTVQDARGRTGQAIAYVEDNPTIGGYEHRLIIDPDTGQTLGEELRAVAPAGPNAWLAPGQLATYHLVLSVGPSDDDPPAVDAP